jgi:hypothetical protein
MNIPIDLRIENKCFRWHSFFPFIIMLILLFSSCTSSPEPYSILEFTGKGEIYNYSRSLYPILYKSDSITSTALLASTGDIITYGENHCFYYDESSQKKFSIKTINNEGFINEKINSISMPRNDDMIPWFNQMKSTDISALGFLFFDSLIVESYMPYLTDLAETNPHIGLGYEGDLTDLDRIFKIFKPRFIVGADLSQKGFNLLSGLSDLEFLSVSLDDSVYTVPLPYMPKLKQLILADIQENAIKCDDFLINNKQLERLTILGSNKFSLLFIESLKNLKELIINGSDTIENFYLIRNHKQIELLSITDEKLSNDIVLRELPNIRWMTFHKDATPDIFISFLDSHPDLEVVEIRKNDTISILQPLLNLRKLYGLTITDTVTDLTTVKLLKNLKYLSLPEDILNDSLLKTDLQKSLPGTMIVANQGVCLGSGWLLLIIPFMVVLKVLIRRKSHKVEVRF